MFSLAEKIVLRDAHQKKSDQIWSVPMESKSETPE